MAYTTLENITIYCADARASGTLPASAWQGNRVWQGALYIPHETNIFKWSGAVDNTYVVIGTGPGLTTTAYYTQLLTYSPDFGVINAVVNGPQVGSRGTLSPLFAGITSAWPGTDVEGLHIVTREGSQQAYVYYPDAGDVGDAYPAEIQADGTLVIDSGTPLCMPRLMANGMLYRFRGCLIHNGLREDGSVGAVVDCAVYGLRSDPGMGVGLRTQVYFFLKPETYAATTAFLNRWLLSRKDVFDPGSFLKGVLTGQRLRCKAPEAAGTVGGVPGDRIRAAYHRQSFLSGLCVGRRLAGQCALSEAGGLSESGRQGKEEAE